MSKGSDLFNSDLEQAKSVFDLRSILKTLSAFKFKHADWKRMISELSSSFDAVEPLPDGWEQRTRAFLDDVRTEMSAPASEDRLDDPEAFFSTYEKEREASITFGENFPLRSYTNTRNTQPIRDALRDIKSEAELELFCMTLSDRLERSEYQGISRTPVMEMLDHASEMLDSSADKGGFSQEVKDQVKIELIRACWLLDKDKNVPAGFGADFDKEFQTQREKFKPAVEFRNDLAQARDAFDLREMLGHVRDLPYYDLTEEYKKEKDEIVRLMDAFDGGSPDAHWEMQTRDVLMQIRDRMETSLMAGSAAGALAATNYEFYGVCKKSGLHPMSPDGSFAAGPDPKTAALRGELEGSRTIDDMEMFCKLIEETPYDGFSRHGVEDQIDKVREILREAKEKQSGQDFAHLLSGETRERAMKELNKALWLMDKDSALPSYLTDPGQVHERLNDRRQKMIFFDNDDDRLLRQTHPEDHKKIERTRQDWHASVNEKIRADAIKNNLPDIYNLCDKMKKDGRRLFGDSEEYKTMRDAAYHVRSLTENMTEADFNDRDKMLEVSKAMEKLHEASKAYAEEKVYGKEKKTSTGVSRKNTALALIDLSDVGKNSGIKEEVDVADMRLDRSESLKTTRSRRGLNELIEAEKRQNEETFGNRGKKQSREAERALKAAQERREKRKNKETAPAQKTSQ